MTGTGTTVPMSAIKGSRKRALTDIQVILKGDR